MGNTLKKSVKIIVGVLISTLLFYFFIKDVNKIDLAADSGAGHGTGKYANRILTLENTSGLNVGDIIKIYDNSHAHDIERKIDLVRPVPGEPKLSEIILSEPLNTEFKTINEAGINFPRLQNALKKANYWWLLPACILTLFSLWIRSYRWKLFFHNHREIKLNSLWVSVCIGYMGNNILPFRMGEIIRAWVLGRKEKRKISESFATIVMERVFDILSILILFVGFTFYFSAKDDIIFPVWLIRGAWVLTLISVLALIFLIALRFRTDKALALISFFLKPFPDNLSSSVMRLFESFIEGLSIFSSLSATLLSFVLSMVIWLDLAVVYFFLFKAVDIEASLLVAVFLIVGLAFAVSLPSAPGFIGTFHFVGKEILLIAGVKGNLEAYVLIAHAMAYVPVVILGFIYLGMENLTFKDLRQPKVPYSNNHLAGHYEK